MFMKILMVLGVLVVIGVGLLMYNHYDVQARGNGEDYDPSVTVLRTPDSYFDALTDFPFAPHYVEIEDPDQRPLSSRA